MKSRPYLISHIQIMSLATTNVEYTNNNRIICKKGTQYFGFYIIKFRFASFLPSFLVSFFSEKYKIMLPISDTKMKLLIFMEILFFCKPCESERSVCFLSYVERVFSMISLCFF